jgi:hypothetical protein
MASRRTMIASPATQIQKPSPVTPPDASSHKRRTTLRRRMPMSESTCHHHLAEPMGASAWRLHGSFTSGVYGLLPRCTLIAGMTDRIAA